MRAWLKVLTDRHPEVTWIPVSHQPVTAPAATTEQLTVEKAELARSA
jgi:hypothetical protein